MTVDQPDNARAWQNLAITSVQAVAAGEPLELYNRAEVAIDRARALAPGDRMNDIAAGYLGLARHDFATARVHGLAAHESDPFDSNALAILIDAEIELGNYTAAGQRIEELLALRPGLAAYSRLSYFRELNGDINGAREAFALAETAGAGSVFDLANVAVLRGKLAVADGNATEAASAFERARQYVATANGATAGEARVLIARGEYARAVALLEQAMVDEPSAENALLLRDLYLFQGSTAGVPALDTFLDDNASEERAAGADVDLELGVIEADRGNAAEAVRLAQRGVRHPTRERVHGVGSRLGVARCRRRRRRVALRRSFAAPRNSGRGVPIPGRRRVGSQWADRPRCAGARDGVRDQSGLLLGQACRRLRTGGRPRRRMPCAVGHRASR